MLILEILEAFFYIGLPVSFMSWYLVRRMYESGRIPRGASIKEVRVSVKGAKSDWKDKQNDYNFLQTRWMKFGGGFYGITAVTTLILIELSDAFKFVLSFPGFSKLFEEGFMSLLIEIFINQIQNIVVSFLWFVHWGDDNNTFLVWVIVPYLSYLLGAYLAGKSREEISISFKSFSKVKPPE